jgi:hypothetical protein
MVDSRPGWRETKKMQIEFATICNKNEQYNDKTNAEL